MIATAKTTPAAREDLLQISQHIAEQNPDAAHRFLDAAEHLFTLLAKHPRLGRAYPHPNYPDLRVQTVSRSFRNYAVFYRSIEAGVEVVRVLHGARNLPAALDS